MIVAYHGQPGSSPAEHHMCDFDGHIKRLTTVPDPWIDAIEGRVQADPAAWVRWDADKPNRFGVFEGSTQHIVCWQFPSCDCPVTGRPSTFRSGPNLGSLIEPILQHVGADLRVRLEGSDRARDVEAKLNAGAEIARHIDGSRSAAVPHFKVHVPIRTSPEVEFWERSDTYHPRARLGLRGQFRSHPPRVGCKSDFAGSHSPDL